MSMRENREAQADALIGEIRRQRAGYLTVFLGAAAGVGKTYAMLSRARELRRQDVDIVVGIVETHGRSETTALLDGLTVIPRRRIERQGCLLEEMDLDALLARRPQVALVDELAHRNVPSSRHERRWQDIEELLDAGIDVYSTVNVQHLESLNDLVYQITGVRVSETVPDSLFDRLRDIRLVDLPPAELIERINQGKVYLPDQAAHALQAFFSPSNLAALRELAMQTAADYVDSDLREARIARGVSGVPLRHRVLVAIDGLGQSEYLVRIGRRIAERRDAPWTVVTVQSGPLIDEARQLELDHALALVRKLGGTTEVLHGASIVDALLDYASSSGVSAIILGRTRERPLARMFNRTLTQQLLKRGAHYELTIVSTPKARARSRRLMHEARMAFARREPIEALIATILAIAVAWMAEQWVGLQDLSMVFIVAVVLVASRTRMIGAVLTALLCFFAYNMLFIEPRFTFHIGATTAMLFLVAALVAGRLASRLRMQVLALRASNVHATTLQSLGRQLATAADLGQVLRAGRAALISALRVEAWIRINGRKSPDDMRTPMADTDLAAADWAQSHAQPAGRYTDTMNRSNWWFLPVKTDQRTIGVIGLHFPETMRHLRFEQRRLAEAMVEDIGQAALRARLVADLETARVSGETERLRSALLSSVSHDLRSPLASMIGAAESLDSYGSAMDAADRRSLLETIRQEGERLDRYIQNLLDMTKLGHEGLTLTRDWIGIDELVGSAVKRLQRYLPSARFEISIPGGLRLIWVHPALVEQAIFNVLENAAKFSPRNEPVVITANRADDGRLRIDIEDRGPGIPDDERQRIFDMFYSVERGDRGRHGTGLGLTICRGIIDAHEGTVEALPAREAHGTLIRISLPWAEAPTRGEIVDQS